MIEPMEKIPDLYCDVCHRSPDFDADNGGCICPECRICGVVGDPKCWTDHFPAAPQAQEETRGAPAPHLGPWGVNERRDALNILRQVCQDHGDNDFPDHLHLGDAIEKHLWRHLEAEPQPPAPASPAAPPIKLRIIPGESTPQDTANLLEALAQLYRAYGGTGIEFTITPAAPEAGAPGTQEGGSHG